jgi:signal transduction histidine kinase
MSLCGNYPLLAIAIYQNVVGGLHVHSRRLEDISQASLDQIKSLLFLFEAGQQISGSLDLNVIVDNAVRGIARALVADECAIAFLESGKPGQMRLVAIYNPSRQGRGESVAFPLEYQLLVQQAMRRKRYVIAEESDNVQLKVLFALMGSAEVGPILVQPLVAEGEAIGAIVVGNSRSQRSFTPNEAKLCQSMADQLLGAIQNARRYQNAQDELAGLKEALDEKNRLVEESCDQAQKSADQLSTLQAEAEDLARRAEADREQRNALEIKLVTSQAEAEALAQRLVVLESDLKQAHANLEAQLHWHEDELARRQAEWDETVEVAQWTESLLQSMTAGILLASSDALIQEANLAAEILLDRDYEELQGLELGLISDDSRWQRAVASAAEGEAVRLTTQVGANTLMCDVAPWPDLESPQGQMKGIIVILQDISAEVEEQQVYLQNAASMVDELRTPMTSILSYVDLLLSEAVGLVGESQHKFLSRIQTSAERLVDMTNDLTRLTRGEESWTRPRCRPVDISTLVELAVAGCSDYLEDRALAIDLDLAENLAIRADPDHLRRVMSYLLSNACLASAVGGRIEVRTAHANGLGVDQAPLDVNGDDFVIVSVRDTGGGLSEDALPRVFDRTRPSQTPSGLGESGAGLDLVKTLVEAHGGRIWFESETGVGTTFSFVLPLNEQPDPPITAPMVSEQGEAVVG